MNHPDTTTDHENTLLNTTILQNGSNSMNMHVAARTQNILESIASEKIQEYRNILIQNPRTLKRMNIICINDVYYLQNAKKPTLWFSQFPNAQFNHQNGIGNERGVLEHQEHTRKLFKVLQFRIATDAEELALREKSYQKRISMWKRQLPLFCHNILTIKDGIHYLEEEVGTNYHGLRPWDRELIQFCKDYTIGKNRRGRIMLDRESLKKLFSLFGYRVATDKEERDFFLELKKEQQKIWRDRILANEKFLDQIGIVQQNGVWYFNQSDYSAKTTHYGEKNAVDYFPNVFFDALPGTRAYYDEIQNTKHPREIFEILGLQVATNEEELSYLKALSKTLNQIVHTEKSDTKVSP